MAAFLLASARPLEPSPSHARRHLHAVRADPTAGGVLTDYALIFPEAAWTDITEVFAREQLETAAYGLIGVFETKRRTEFLVREVVFLRDDDYEERLPYHLLIRQPRVVRGIIRRCEETGLGAVAMHSHPGSGKVDFSLSDDFGERRELKVFHDLLGASPLASLVWGPGGALGRAWRFEEGSRAVPIDELVLVGRRRHVIR